MHFVTAELDGGPVLAQACVPVLPGDTPERLAARLLPLEHRLLVASLGALLSGRVRLRGDRVWVDGHAAARPLQLRADGNLS